MTLFFLARNRNAELDFIVFNHCFCFCIPLDEEKTNDFYNFSNKKQQKKLFDEIGFEGIRVPQFIIGSTRPFFDSSVLSTCLMDNSVVAFL